MIPLLFQLWMSGYIFAFQLPQTFIGYLGSGGNQSLLKFIHQMPYEKHEYGLADAAEGMATAVGPSIHESETYTAEGDKYAKSAVVRPAVSSFVEMCKYYREGAALSPWEKSVETITSLHSIVQGNEIRHTSSVTGVFDEGLPGALKAPTTIVWGSKDTALTRELCLDGISDYLPRKSQVVELPDSEHWTPMERRSRLALTKVVEWTMAQEQEDIGAVIEACYPKAVVKVRK